LRPYDEDDELGFGKNQEYVPDKDISSKDTVPLKLKMSSDQEITSNTIFSLEFGKYKYDVVVRVKSETKTINGQMYIIIEPCTGCEKVKVGLKSFNENLFAGKIIAGKKYGCDHFYLNVPIEDVKGVTFRLESTDPNEKAKIMIDYVHFRLLKKENQLDQRKPKDHVYMSSELYTIWSSV